jgi:hypothetical protein
MKHHKQIINFIIAWVLIIFAIKIFYEVVVFSVKVLNNF